MLNVLRDNFKNKPYLKWLLILVAASLTAYLGAYFFERPGGAQGPSGDWAVRVNESAVPIRVFQLAAQNRAAYYRQLLGESYDPAVIAQEVVSSLIAREIMRQEARKAGLEVSPDELSREILRDPTFHDAQGNFVGKERYAQAVRTLFRSDLATYEQEVASEILTRKWRDLVTDPVTVSDEDVEQLYRYRNEKTAIDYVLLPAADQQADLDVTDEDLREWYEAHRQDYRRPEGREIRLVVVERQAKRDEVVITDEEVAESYEINRAALSHPEQRRARHILFRVEPGASEATEMAVRKQGESVLKRLREGEDFASLARAMSQDPASARNGGDLGFFGRGAMVPEFDEAVFATEPGAFAPLVRSDFGYHVIQVTDSRPAGVTPLEEVQDDLRQSLRVRRAQEMVREQAQRIAEQASSAAEFAAAAEREGLAVQTRSIRRGDALRDLGPSPEFLRAAFDLPPGAVSTPLGVARGMAVLAVDRELAADVAPLEEVENRVRQDLLNQRLRDVALARGKRALERGRSLQAAAKSLGAEVQESGDLIPGQEIPGTGGYSPELRERLFGAQTETGQQGVVPVPAGALVYRIVHHQPFDTEQFEQARPVLRQELLTERRQALLDSVLRHLFDTYRIEVNEQVVSAANT